jgi:hypothetical protein
MYSAAADQIVSRFKNRAVIIDTPIGEVVGVLVGADNSLHRGVGTLVLGVGGGSRILVRSWTVIKLERSQA